ncbi:MAG: putative glycoside hydrolase [Patescibacteria group bacterium]
MIRKLWDNGTARLTLIVVGAFVVCAIAFAVTLFLPMGKVSFPNVAALGDVATSTEITPELPPPLPPIPAHIKTPASVRAVYMSSWAAGNAKFRKHLFDIIDTTEINAVVFDIKDYTGRISYKVDDPVLAASGAVENRIPDIKDFIASLHAKNIYVIGRLSSFQDSFLVKDHPEWAVKTLSGEVWKDHKGVKWLDAGAKPVWKYIVAIGRDAYNQGFDELNFDYIRFPSDGNMKDISYDWSTGKTREETMKSFFEYVHEQFATSSVVISADLFGLTTSARDDLGIGQVLEDALLNFDYVAPMVYPSHFGTGYLGFVKPAQHPYEVIENSMSSAIKKAEVATTSPTKLRPWLQAFDLGATYTPDMIRAQIQATYDVGLDSWMLWDAASVYDKDALKKDKNDPIVRKVKATPAPTPSTAPSIASTTPGM